MRTRYESPWKLCLAGVASALILASSPALADEVPRPSDGWMIQGNAYPVLVDNLTGLWADVPPVQPGFTKTCNVRFLMQPGKLTQTAFGKCIGGLEESMNGFLQAMYIWPLEDPETTEANGAGLNVVLRSYTWGTVPRLEAEAETPFLENRDGQLVPFTVWSPAVARSGPEPELSKKAAKRIGQATCTLSVDVEATGATTNIQVIDCPEGAHKAAVKAAEDWVFEPHKVDNAARPSQGMLVFSFGDN